MLPLLPAFLSESLFVAQASRGVSPQHYGLGVKEVGEPSSHQLGGVVRLS